MGERSNTKPYRKKAKVGDKGELEGWGVQRGNRFEGEKCRLLLRFYCFSPSMRFPLCIAVVDVTEKL